MRIIIIILYFTYKLIFLFLSDNFFCCNFPVLDFFGEEENPESLNTGKSLTYKKMAYLK